jgi:hypothetical protein
MEIISPLASNMLDEQEPLQKVLQDDRELKLCTAVNPGASCIGVAGLFTD